MAPLDPRYLIRLSGGRRIAHHEWCRKCRYDLIGLRSSQRCPECGTPIEFETAFREDGIDYGPEVIYRDPGPFLEAPRRYLVFLAAAFIALGIAGPAIYAVLVAFLFWPRPELAGAAMVAAAVWVGASWAVTSPRRVAIAKNIDSAREWRHLRRTVRWTQWTWLLVGAFGLVFTLPNVIPPAVCPLPTMRLIALLTAAAAAMAGAAGAAALCIYISNLLFWVGDSALASRLRECAWVLGGAALFGAPAWATGIPKAMARGLIDFGHWGQVIVGSIGIAAALAVLYPVLCLLQVGHSGRWIQRELSEGAGGLSRRGRPPPGVSGG